MEGLACSRSGAAVAAWAAAAGPPSAPRMGPNMREEEATRLPMAEVVPPAAGLL